MHVLCSFVKGKSNIGTDNDIGEDFDGDSWSIGNEARDLLIEIFRISDTGEREMFP
jgi:hypothetical protein